MRKLKSEKVGVTFNRGRWMAHINIAGRLVNLGRYDSIKEASRARQGAETELRRVGVSQRKYDSPTDSEWKKWRFHAEPARCAAEV